MELYIDPPTRHFRQDKLFGTGPAAHLGDQFLAPYVFLREVLEARGVKVHTADLLPAAPPGAKRLYVSLGELSTYRKLRGRNDVVLSAFMALECPTVEPRNYRELRDAQHVFKRIYSWSDSEALEPYVGGPLRCLPMWWPQSFEAVHETIWANADRGFLIMINGNKKPRYATPGHELYSERLRAVEFFGRTGEIDLYGNGWDRPTMRVGQSYVPGTFGSLRMPGTVQRVHRAAEHAWQRLRPDPVLTAARKRYRGFAHSKPETLGKYKFAICFENSILKGWITEKIFDCFFSGTIPVYWGAPDIEQQIPANCFIDMRRFRDYAGLGSYLRGLAPREIQQFKDNARAFLASPAYRRFTKQAFAEMFVRMVQEDAGAVLPEVNPVSVPG